MRRFQRLSAIPTLVGLVFALDLLWAQVAGSTGSLAYGLIDEPAHLATCAVLLLLLAFAGGRALPLELAVPALVASVAIDLDHLPHLLGSQALTGGLPRPYSHSLALVALLALAVALWPRRGGRLLLGGLALGVGAHLLRDVATGPGVSLLWPLSDDVVQVPYFAYATLLAAAAVWALRPGLVAARLRRAGATAVLATPSRRGGELAALLLLAAAALGLHPHAAQARPSISTGAYLPGADRDPSLIEQFSEETGRHPALVSFYREWGPPLVDPRQLEAASGNGSVPMLTWEPWDEEDGVPLWSIAAGEEDGYISQAAEEAAAWGGPIFLRFAHEMNGDWYPWGWGVDGNTPAAFKAAWRHVVDVFRGAGATNVRWVWCPYVSNKKLKQFRRFYPGDEYVDWACFDGFNWGSYRSWQSFKEIFALSYDSVVKFTRRPIMIGETGVNQVGGDKPRWLSRSLRKALPKYTHVRAVVWYDTADYRADFRIDSSPEALAAFRGALSLPVFASGAEALLNTPPELAAPKKKHRKRLHRGRRQG